VSLNDLSKFDAGLSTSLLLVVAAALIDESGHVLMQRRPVGKAHADLWEFPGGKVEAGETPERALVRELREELGIEVDPADVIPFSFAIDHQSPRPVLLMLFTCRRWRSKVTALDAAALCWDHPAKLRGLPMPPLDQPLLDALVARVGRG
jgi:8-oxo-dGTP diphosphatase